MTRKRQLADALREGLAGAAERGRVLGQALKVRADIAASRRQLKTTFGELGKHVYSSIKAGDLPAAAGAEGTRCCWRTLSGSTAARPTSG